MNSPYSNANREMTIEPGCPWYEAQQSFGAPNVNWCEPTLCAYINEPANTWSNLGYLFIAIVLIRKLTRGNIKYFGHAVFVMGFLSFTYHATNNYFTQFLDFVGMFLMMSYLLAFNFHRLFKRWTDNFFAAYWCFVFLNTLLFICFDIWNIAIQKIMFLNVLPILLLDLSAGIKEERLKESIYLFVALLFLGVAQVFAIVDIQRIYCEPANLWLHGHVIWHLLGAVGMLFAGLHMKRMQN